MKEAESGREEVRSEASVSEREERVVSVWCVDWPVVVFRRPSDHPIAAMHANRVVACSPAARRHGVERGLRRRESQRRCPGLEVVDRDPQLEARSFEGVVRTLDDLTPRVEILRPGLVQFPARGPSRYFGGDEAMAARCQAMLGEVLAGVGDVRVGVAGSMFASALAARQATADAPHVVPIGGTAAFLAPFPIRSLERPELTSVLARLGLTTLGAFAALERVDVLGRFGDDGGIAHLLASGHDHRPQVMSDPPQEMEVASELDPPVERVDQAAFVGKVLADQFLARLQARGATCTTIVVSAETEHGEQLVRCWRHEGALTAPAVADRVRWQLDGWLNGSSATRPTGGLTRLAVAPDVVLPAGGRQLGFWGGQTEAAERAARVVARVQGILGPAAVTAPERRGGRSPAEQVVAVPADTVDLDRDTIDGAVVAQPWPGALPGPSPTRLHRPRLPARVLDAVGADVHVDGRAQLSAEPATMRIDTGDVDQIASWAGPWPMDERWWDRERHRRRARLQVVDGRGVARLLVVEGGRWWVEATYD